MGGPAAQPVAGRCGIRSARWLVPGLVAAVAAALAAASFLPWYTYSGIAGPATVSGMEMGGVVTLPMAGIALAMAALAVALRRPVLAAVAALCGAVAEVVVIRALWRILSRPSYVDFGGHLPHVGLALAGLAAAGLVVAGLAALLVGLRGRRPVVPPPE
jgi:hypothetical protein